MNQGDARAATTKFLKEELSQTPEVYNALKEYETWRYFGCIRVAGYAG